MNLNKVVEELKDWDGLKSYSESYQIGYNEALDDLLQQIESSSELNLRAAVENLTRYDDSEDGCQTDPSGSLLWRDDVLALADKFELIDNRSCPCLYGTPCSPECSCVHLLSSRGCDCCCSHGSKEQRAESAKRIKESLNFTGDFVKLTELADQNKCDGHCDEKSPFKRCPECIAVDAINKASEILKTALSRIERNKNV